MLLFEPPASPKPGESKNMRDAVGDALAALGALDERIVVLDCDLGHSTKVSRFGDQFPERYFEMGIAEQNMVSVAAGLAETGKVAFASTFAIFVTGRAWEQVRLSAGYTGADVKVLATHAGVATGEDGASHQMAEDIAIMGAIPGMKVYTPSDYYSALSLIQSAYETEGPVYLRLARPTTPVIYAEPPDITAGCTTLREGADILFVAHGILVPEALGAAALLEKKGIGAGVVDVHRVKPLPEKLKKLTQDAGVLAVLEDHVRWGGLGAALMSEMAGGLAGVKVERVDLGDSFGQSGTYTELYEHYGFNASGLAKRALGWLSGVKA